MNKNKTLEDIAKILFQYHEKDEEYNQRKWEQLNHERTDSNPYSVSKSEYFRMAKGIYKYLQTKHDEN